MFPLVPAGTDPDSRPSRLQTWPRCWRAGPRGGQNGVGCVLGAPRLFPPTFLCLHVTLPCMDTDAGCPLCLISAF